MIFETRQLVFTATALKKAMEWYAQVPGQTDLPHGLITAVTPRPGGGVAVQLQQAGATNFREVPFSPSKMLGILLFFCRKQRIPIPRDAEKDIASEEDCIVLTISGQTKAVGPKR